MSSHPSVIRWADARVGCGSVIEFIAGLLIGAVLYAGIRPLFGRSVSSVRPLDYYTVPPQGGPYGRLYEPLADIHSAYEGNPYDDMRKELKATLMERMAPSPQDVMWPVFEDDDESM